jgi:hypothetical protein
MPRIARRAHWLFISGFLARPRRCFRFARARTGLGRPGWRQRYGPSTTRSHTPAITP